MNADGKEARPQIAPAFAGPMAGKQISQRIGNYLFFNSRHTMD
jgi:hypothetical protein